MVTYDWFNIYNKTIFLAEGIPSKKLEYEFEGYDIKTIVLTNGNAIGVIIEDVFLAVGMNDKDPFEFEDYAVTLDPATQDIWVGIKVES